MDALTERTCPDCHGTGCILQPEDCATCGGRGVVSKMDNTAENPHLKFIDDLAEWIIATEHLDLSDRNARAVAVAAWEYLADVRHRGGARAVHTCLVCGTDLLPARCPTCGSDSVLGDPA